MPVVLRRGHARVMRRTARTECSGGVPCVLRRVQADDSQVYVLVSGFVTSEAERKHLLARLLSQGVGEREARAIARAGRGDRGPALRGSSPRHREAARLGGDHPEADAADRRGDAGRADARRGGREHRGPDGLPRCRRSCDTPPSRAVGRPGVPGSSCGRGDPAARPRPRRRRRLRGHDVRARVQQGVAARDRASRSSAAPARSSTPRWSPRSRGCSAARPPSEPWACSPATTRRTCSLSGPSAGEPRRCGRIRGTARRASSFVLGRAEWS